MWIKLAPKHDKKDLKKRKNIQLPTDQQTHPTSYRFDKIQTPRSGNRPITLSVMQIPRLPNCIVEEKVRKLRKTEEKKKKKQTDE